MFVSDVVSRIVDRKPGKKRDNGPEMPRIRFPQEEEFKGGLFIPAETLRGLVGDCEEKTGKEGRLCYLA